jgi:hypothetical protein
VVTLLAWDSIQITAFAHTRSSRSRQSRANIDLDERPRTRGASSLRYDDNKLPACSSRVSFGLSGGVGGEQGPICRLRRCEPVHRGGMTGQSLEIPVDTCHMSRVGWLP